MWFTPKSLRGEAEDEEELAVHESHDSVVAIWSAIWFSWLDLVRLKVGGPGGRERGATLVEIGRGPWLGRMGGGEGDPLVGVRFDGWDGMVNETGGGRLEGEDISVGGGGLNRV